MIDKFIIFSKTGVVLWTVTLVANDNDYVERINSAISTFIQDILLSHRTVNSNVNIGDFSIKYLLSNELGLVFAAVVNKQFLSSVTYLDKLILAVKTLFLEKYESTILQKGVDEDFNFQSTFYTLLDQAERSLISGSGSSAKHAAKRLEQAPSEGDMMKNLSISDPASDGEEEVPAEFAAMEAARAKMQAKKLALAEQKGKKKAPQSPSSPVTPSGKGKASREWSDIGKFDEKTASSLDRSAKGTAPQQDQVEKVAFTGGKSKSGANYDDDDGEFAPNLFESAAARGKLQDAATSAAEASAPKTALSSVASWLSRSKVVSFVSSFVGTKVLASEDLAPIMIELESLLVSKNVTSEITSALCASVQKSLLGQKVTSAQTISEMVYASMQDAVYRILTPKRSIDVLKEVRDKVASRSGPYVIVFVGVNGVGKSTSLAKTAFYLKDHGFSVMIAACDSFRAGAVEQLKRHCAALDVPLFQQGYAKDPVAIAKAAIEEASHKESPMFGSQVVLIDTAGRMQNNGPLMQQLAKLVAVNKPDLVLFVGEALVGNDGVDQLCEFDRALVDYAVDSNTPRKIDGILLTKFDTIDDKVGTALSMVYKTGIPVVFLGVGQHYQDLRKLNVSAVVKSLFA
jgi:signal recognition particle receptor subunit alpha